MDFNEYQELTQKTATFGNAEDALFYLGLGIADEAGEVAGKLKKFIRDCNIKTINDLTDDQKKDVAKEIGDVLWYAAQLSLACGYEFGEVAKMNIEKTHSRLERGKIHGSGDNR